MSKLTSKEYQQILATFLLNIAPRIFLLFTLLMLAGVGWLFITFILNGGAGGSADLSQEAILFSIVYALVFFYLFVQMVKKLFPAREITQEVFSTVENEVVLEESLKWTQIIYALQVISVFFMLPLFIAGFFNYSKKDLVKGTWLETHFKWQMDTFWVALGFIIVSSLLHLFKNFIGWSFLVDGVNIVWMIYRTTKGLVSLNKKKSTF